MLAQRREFSSITTFKAGARPAINNFAPYANNNIVVDPGANGQQAAPGINIFTVQPIYPKTFSMQPDAAIVKTDVFKERKSKKPRVDYRRNPPTYYQPVTYSGGGIKPPSAPPKNPGDTGDPPEDGGNLESNFQTSMQPKYTAPPKYSQSTQIKSEIQPTITNLGFETGYQTAEAEIRAEERNGDLLKEINAKYLFPFNTMSSEWVGGWSVNSPATSNPRITSTDRGDPRDASIQTQDATSFIKEEEKAREYEKINAELHKLELELQQYKTPTMDFSSQTDATEIKKYEKETGLSNAETGTDDLMGSIKGMLSNAASAATQTEKRSWRNKAMAYKKRLDQYLTKISKKKNRPNETYRSSVETRTDVAATVKSNIAPQFTKRKSSVGLTKNIDAGPQAAVTVAGPPVVQTPLKTLSERAKGGVKKVLKKLQKKK